VISLKMSTFMEGDIVMESKFFEKVNAFDWESFRDQRVLVQGCGTTAIPPWAFMAVASRLAPIAKVIKYGNDHSSVAVYRRPKETTDAET